MIAKFLPIDDWFPIENFALWAMEQVNCQSPVIGARCQQSIVDSTGDVVHRFSTIRDVVLRATFILGEPPTALLKMLDPLGGCSFS